MLRIEWEQRLEIGNATVDEQHQGLVELFNELVSAERSAEGPSAVSAVLERLTEYVVVHFSAEESLMATASYPGQATEAHIAEHRGLTARTRELVIDYRNGDIDSIVPVALFLQEWLTGHIQESDCRLIEHIRQQTP